MTSVAGRGMTPEIPSGHSACNTGYDTRAPLGGGNKTETTNTALFTALFQCQESTLGVATFQQY